MKHTTRAVLAVSLLLAPYVVALVVAAGLLVTAVTLTATGHTGGALWWWLAVAVLGIAAAVRSARSARRVAPSPPGVALTEEAQPMLWAEVRSLAEMVQTPVPDEIRLVPEAGVALVEQSRRLGLARGPRRLLLGVPLLQRLSRNQLRGMIAHDLHHDSTADGRLTPLVHRGQAALAGAAGRVPRPLQRPFTWYARLYLALARPIVHRRETESDQVAAQIAGPETAAAALRELPVLRTAWVDYLDSYVAIGEPHGMRPTRLFDGFAAMVADPRRRQRLHPLRVDLPEPLPSAYDTHAPIRDRVAALAALSPATSAPVTGSPDESGRALDVLQYSGQALLALEDRYFAGSGLMAAPLDAIVARVGAERAAARSRTLLEAMEHHGIVPATLAGALDLLAQQRPEPLLDLAPLEGVDPYTAAQHQHEVVSALLGDALAYALVTEEKAAYAMSWSGLGSLRDPAGEEIDPTRLAAEALSSPGYAAALRSWLHQLEVKLDAAPAYLHHVEHTDPATPTGYLGAIAPVTGHGFAAFLVTDAGLLLVRPALTDHVHLPHRSPGPALVRRCLARPAATVADDPRALHMAWPEIRALHVSRGPRTTAALTLHDGRGWTVSWSTSGTEQGTPWPPVEHFLGHRFTTD